MGIIGRIKQWFGLGGESEPPRPTYQPYQPGGSYWGQSGEDGFLRRTADSFRHAYDRFSEPGRIWPRLPFRSRGPTAGQEPLDAAEAYAGLAAKYRAVRENLERAANRGQWAEVARLCEEELPPLSLQKAEDRLHGFAPGFSGLARELRAIKSLVPRLYHGLAQDGQAAQRPAEHRELCKRMLKAWRTNLPGMGEAEKDLLARMLLEDGEDRAEWVQFCLARLAAGAELNTERLSGLWRRAFEVAELDSSNLVGPEALARRARLKLGNAQAAQSGRREFAHAFLHLARLEAVGPGAAPEGRDGQGLDGGYVEWLMERALDAGLELGSEDSLLVGHAKFSRGRYGEVVDLLEGVLAEEAADGLPGHRRLLAMAHYRLWESREAKGDPGRAAGLLEELNDRGKLGNDDLFILCQLLDAIGRGERARQVFALLDLADLDREDEAIIDFAVKAGLLDLAGPFLSALVEKDPASQAIWSAYCELCRAYEGRLAQSRRAMERLSQLNPKHPWVLLRDCHELLDQAKAPAAQRQISQLPEGEAWRLEKALLHCRISLSRGDWRGAAGHLDGASGPARDDRRFLQVLVLAHGGDPETALLQAPDQVDDPLWARRFASLKVRLLVSLQRFSQAEELLPAADENEVRDLLPWIYLGLGKYDLMVKVCQARETDELRFLWALAQEKSNHAVQALMGYRAFLAESHGKHPLAEQAARRMAGLALRQEDLQQARWLASQPGAAKILPPGLRAQLWGLCDQWGRAVEDLLKEGGEGQRENLAFAVARLLEKQIAQANWDRCQKLLQILAKKHPEALEPMAAQVLTAKTLHAIKNTAHEKEIELPDEDLPGPAALFARVRKVIEGRLSLAEFLRLTRADGGDPESQPELAFLILALRAALGDKEELSLSPELLESACGLEDPDGRLVASGLRGLCDESWAVPVDELVERRAVVRGRLPLEEEGFWARLALLAARGGPLGAGQGVRILEACRPGMPEVASAVRVASATAHIQSGDFAQAISDLQEAVK